MAVLAYKYRLYPTKEQETKMGDWLESLRLLYNFALAERRDAYKKEKRSLSVYEQKRFLPDLKRRFVRYASVHSQVLQDAPAKAGKPFVLVGPKGTTQERSRCGAVVLKPLAGRTHMCPECGITLDRDHNSAIVIETRAGTARSHACGEATSTDEIPHPQVAPLKQETSPFRAG